MYANDVLAGNDDLQAAKATFKNILIEDVKLRF